MSVGGKNVALQQEAFGIFSTCIARHIRGEPEWIPRNKNKKADYLSRIIDHDDWKVNPSIFASLDQCWGPHVVDRFASYYNAQLPCFNSRFSNPGTEAVDAFTCDWGWSVKLVVPTALFSPTNNPTCKANTSFWNSNCPSLGFSSILAGVVS